jgi:hypothetical protein
VCPLAAKYRLGRKVQKKFLRPMSPRPDQTGRMIDWNAPRSRVARWFRYFETKNLNLGIFWRAMVWKMLAYFTVIGYNLWPFGIMYGRLV